MSDYPTNVKYTKEHEWARRDGDVVVVGVTFHAQEALGDVVFVELPKVGDTVRAGEKFGVIESTKAVSELFAPVTGAVTKVNEALTAGPQAVNQDPYGAGWLIQVKPADVSSIDQLLDAAAYQRFLTEQA